MTTNTSARRAASDAGDVALWTARTAWRLTAFLLSALVLSAVAMLVTTMGTAGVRPTNRW